MKTIEITVYSFDELSDEAKKVALQENANINVSDEFWYEYILEDAMEVGIKIKEFDSDRYCHISIDDCEATALKILNSHGKDCETYLDATRYLSERESLLTSIDYSDAQDDSLEALDYEFKHDLAEDYRIMLNREYEYQVSDEAIAESLRANDYQFLDTGKLCLNLLRVL